MKKLLTLLGALLISGCVASISTTIKEYEKVADQVNLGDSKARVLAVLNPTQAKLDTEYKKTPDRYIKNDVLVEIYYMRSGWQSDGLTTDDEFTPYIFNNGKLVGIGWAMLGGAKTQGQAPTVIHNNNSVIVY